MLPRKSAVKIGKSAAVIFLLADFRPISSSPSGVSVDPVSSIPLVRIRLAPPAQGFS